MKAYLEEINLLALTLALSFCTNFYCVFSLIIPREGYKGVYGLNHFLVEFWWHYVGKPATEIFDLQFNPYLNISLFMITGFLILLLVLDFALRAVVLAGFRIIGPSSINDLANRCVARACLWHVVTLVFVFDRLYIDIEVLHHGTSHIVTGLTAHRLAFFAGFLIATFFSFLYQRNQIYNNSLKIKITS
jgi:hypothetical protein